MPKIGSYEYPKTQLGTLLKAVEVLVTKFHGKATDEKTFAEAIGHTTHNSGGYLVKLADLRKYGLLDKGLTATDRAKHIVKPLTPQERAENLSQAVMEVSLWKDLYGRIGKSSLSTNDFKLHLVEVTRDRDRSLADAEVIKGLYSDAISNYSEDFTKNDTKINDTQPNNQSNDSFAAPPIANSNLSEIRFEDIYIRFPKDDLDAAETAKELIDMKIKQMKRKSSSD